MSVWRLALGSWRPARRLGSLGLVHRQLANRVPASSWTRQLPGGMARFSTDTTPPPPPKTSRRKFGWILLKLSLVGATGMLLFEVYSKRHPGPQLDFDPSLETVVVLGSGWGATSFLQDLDTLNYNVICVSPRNYFLFTPLLPSCTVGTIESRSIMQPMRYITRFKRRNVRFVEAECTQIDHVGRTITVQDNSEISCEEPVTLKYDKLIVAVGAKNATFGVPGVEEHACFLKEISDAKKIRRRYTHNFLNGLDWLIVSKLLPFQASQRQRPLGFCIALSLVVGLQVLRWHLRSPIF